MKDQHYYLHPKVKPLALVQQGEELLATAKTTKVLYPSRLFTTRPIDFKKRHFPMKKLILAFSIVVICSYFTDSIPTVEASERHSVTHSSKHRATKLHKVKHHSKASKSHHRSIASWYGHRFHGKKTASGERFNMYAMTAASKTLPLLSYAEVTNLKNHRSVIVRINDRGPYSGRRSLDLSYAAAKEIGIRGTGAVKITPLGRNRG